MGTFTQDHYAPDLHLFVDDEEIRQIWGVRRGIGRVNNSAEPIMTPDAPWEQGRVYCPYAGSVVIDPLTGRLRMYYYQFGISTDPGDLPMNMMLCLAESEDGLHWTRPELELVEWNGSKKNNILLTGERLARGDPDALHDVRGPVAIDPGDREFPYKLFAWGQNLEHWNASLAPERLEKLRRHTGYYYLQSSDGLRWSEPVKVKEGGDTFGYSWDSRRNMWMLADRMGAEPNAFHHYVRLIEMYESPDLQHWTRQGRAMILGEEHNFGMQCELWGMIPFVYGDQYLALLGVSSHLTGAMWIVLAASRDGRRWHLPLRTERFLPIGEPGQWNGETTNVTLNPPLRRGNRLYIHYTARNSSQDGQGPAQNYLGLATLAVDRFVGMSSGGKEGFILTEPVLVTQPCLEINMTNTWGYVQVEVRDSENRVIPGYETTNCIKLQQRDTHVRVLWKEKQDLGRLVGRRCVFKFTIFHATLYSYRFTPEEEADITR